MAGTQLYPGSMGSAGDVATSAQSTLDSATNTLNQITELKNAAASALPETTEQTNPNGTIIAPKDKEGKEKNAPVPNKGQTNTTPTKGTPTVPPTAISKVTKNGIGYTNDNLVHICDFTIELDLKVCGKRFELIEINETLRAESLGAWAASMEIPFLDEIRSAYNTLKGWYDMIKSYLDEIKSWIKCLQSIIQAIQTVISFIANLPASVLSQVMSCISGYENLLTDAINSTVDAIKVDIKSQTAGDSVAGKLDEQSTKQSDAQASLNTSS